MSLWRTKPERVIGSLFEARCLDWTVSWTRSGADPVYKVHRSGAVAARIRKEKALIYTSPGDQIRDTVSSIVELFAIRQILVGSFLPGLEAPWRPANAASRRAPACPVTGRPAVRHIQWVAARLLTDLWRIEFKTDVRPSFRGID